MLCLLIWGGFTHALILVLTQWWNCFWSKINEFNTNLDEWAFMVVADVIRFAIPILKSSAQCPTVSTLCIVKPVTKLISCGMYISVILEVLFNNFYPLLQALLKIYIITGVIYIYQYLKIKSDNRRLALSYSQSVCFCILWITFLFIHYHNMKA